MTSLVVRGCRSRLTGLFKNQFSRLTTVILLSVFAVACSPGPPGPANTQIEEAVREALQRDTTWVAASLASGVGLLSGRTAVLEEIKVLNKKYDKGEPDAGMKAWGVVTAEPFWLVVVQIKGHVEARSIPFYNFEETRFDERSTFRVYPQGNGTWLARPI